MILYYNKKKNLKNMLVSYIITIITFTTTNFCKKNENQKSNDDSPPDFNKTMKTINENFGKKEIFCEKNKFIVFLYVYCNVFSNNNKKIVKTFMKYENEFKKYNVFADYNLDIGFNMIILKFIAENNGEYFMEFLKFSPFFKKFYDTKASKIINYDHEKNNYTIKLRWNEENGPNFFYFCMQEALNNIFEDSKLLSKKPDKNIIKLSNACYIIYFDDFLFAYRIKNEDRIKCDEDLKKKILDKLKKNHIGEKEKYEDIIFNIFLKLKNDNPEILETYIEGILSYSSGNRKKNFLKFIMDRMPEITNKISNKTKDEKTNKTSNKTSKKTSKKTKDENTYKKTNEIKIFCNFILQKYYFVKKIQCIYYFNNKLLYDQKKELVRLFLSKKNLHTKKSSEEFNEVSKEVDLFLKDFNEEEKNFVKNSNFFNIFCYKINSIILEDIYNEYKTKKDINKIVSILFENRLEKAFETINEMITENQKEEK